MKTFKPNNCDVIAIEKLITPHYSSQFSPHIPLWSTPAGISAVFLWSIE